MVTTTVLLWRGCVLLQQDCRQRLGAQQHSHKQERAAYTALGAKGGVQTGTILRTTMHLQHLSPPFEGFDIKKCIFGHL